MYFESMIETTHSHWHAESTLIIALLKTQCLLALNGNTDKKISISADNI
jgi:hypothetical protein